MEPTASMLYDGIKLAAIHQSSAAKEALLLHRATKRRITATVARSPHATVTWATRSRSGLMTSMGVLMINSILAGTPIKFMLKNWTLQRLKREKKGEGNWTIKSLGKYKQWGTLIQVIILLLIFGRAAVRYPTCQNDGQLQMSRKTMTAEFVFRERPLRVVQM